MPRKAGTRKTSPAQKRVQARIRKRNQRAREAAAKAENEPFILDHTPPSAGQAAEEAKKKQLPAVDLDEEFVLD